MNAPRQGIYAALLATSFAIHAVLMIQGTEHQLAVTRAAQGELMTGQLAVDSLAAVVATDTVGLALLTRRYNERPDVATVRILGAAGQVLASGGSAPTRGGQSFQQPIALDGRPVGQVELTLVEPTRGELIHDQWLPLLLSVLLHGLLWLLYRVVARPIQRYTPQPQAVKSTSTPSEQPLPQPVVTTPDPMPKVAESALQMPVILKIGFDDPRQLLDTLSPSLASPYFLLCQTLLEQAIRGLAVAQQVTAPNCRVLKKFDAQGATVGLSGAPAAMLAEYALELGSLLNLLLAVVYRRHREQKHFALQTRAVVAVNVAEQDTQHTADQLLAHAHTGGVLIHADDALMAVLLRRTPLSALEHPLNSLMREAMHVEGLSSEQAQRIAHVRDQILSGTLPDSAPN